MLKLAVKTREVFGKKLKSARVAGDLPVVVYGDKKAATSYFVSQKDFKKVLAKAGESTVISLTNSDNDKTKEVLIHDVAVDPVSDEPIHADFYLIDKTKAIEIDVPLHFDGVSPAVKDMGGTLVRVLHELKIEVLPLEIPHDILVDISALANLESQILIKDLKLPSGVKVLNDLEAVVASISVAKEEPVEEAPVDLSAIEVEKKGKKDEEGTASDAVAVGAAGGGGDKGGKKKEEKK